MRESLRIDSPFMGAGMPKAYSRDLRERVITAVETGASPREAAERFEVSVAWAVKWLQRWYQQSSATPKPRGGSVSPLRGRAPRGVRVIGAVPLGRWETITFVAALRHNKMVAPMVVEGAMTGEMFLAYVENCLVPTLRRNDIVVMDNCRVHLGTGIGRAIETVGATLRYLPKYSPDLNPIEMPYSKFKTFLRKVAARTIPSLNRPIRSFIPQRLCFNMIGIRFSLPPVLHSIGLE